MAWTEEEDRREQRRKLIMRAALKIFSKKGYSPTALDEVAQEAGIAKGTLYLYFKDKEDLMYNTIMSVLDHLKERMIEGIPQDLPPLDTLEKIAFILFEYFMENDEFYNIYLTILNYNLLSNYTHLFESMVSRKRELYDFEFQLVEKAKQQGLIRKDIQTMDMVMAYDGIVMNILDQLFFMKKDVEFDPEQKAKLVLRLFLEGTERQGIRTET
jgi:TetR/AcrR family fatty acid metabolism transcriptional regulator